MAGFAGFVQQEGALNIPVLVRNGSNSPKNAAALPAYRVYGPGGAMPNGTGSAAYKDSGTVSGATNASPIAVTFAGHGLSTGAQVTVAGVAGNTAANGDWTITVIDVNTFALNGSTGNGNYASGGTWNVTGLYTVSVACTGANGFQAGNAYSLLVMATVSGTAWADLINFAVT